MGTLMSKDDLDEIGCWASEVVKPQDVQAAIDSVWFEIRSDPAAADAVGLQSSTLPSKAPFRATPGAAGFGVVETIVISVAGSLAKDALEGAWKTYVLPRLQAEFGRRLRPK
jgi:hypothetical protein